MTDIQAKEKFKKSLSMHVKRTDMKVLTLAKLTGASNSQVQRWLNGDLMPDWRQFQRVLEVFGLEDEDILGNSVSENTYNKRFK